MEIEQKNGKLVIFLGGGSSSLANYRTFQSFPHLILNEDVRKKEGLPPVEGDVLRLFQNIEQVLRFHERPVTHDNVMWILDNYTQLLRNLRIDNELKARFMVNTVGTSQFTVFDQLVKKAIEVMVQTTVTHYSKNQVVGALDAQEYPLHDQMRRTHRFFIEAAKINNLENPYIDVFTTNYDLLIEDLFAEFADSTEDDFPLINGFCDPPCGEGWNPDLYQNTEDGRNGLYLYRLHGCVGWSWHIWEDRNVYFHRDGPFDGDLKRVCAMFPGHEIYPGNNPHAFSFDNLYEKLLACQMVAFIGFSFRDRDVKQALLFANARRSVPMKILVVDQSLSLGAIIAELERTASETTLPHKIPTPHQIIADKTSFGAYDFDIPLLSTIKKHCSGDPK